LLATAATSSSGAEDEASTRRARDHYEERGVGFGHLVLCTPLVEHRSMDPWQDPEVSDATLIIGTLFEIKAEILELSDQVTAIRWLLENGDQDEEEEGDDAEP
jgi:hypothetical protein